MPLAQWDPTLSVGVAVLDRDHRALLNMLNELFDAMKQGQEAELLPQLFLRLHEYISTHFVREEAMMAQCGYPDLAAHHSEHLHLATRVSELSQRYQEGKSSDINLELLVLFKTWLMSHIRVSDYQYKAYLVGIDPEGAGKV